MQAMEEMQTRLHPPNSSTHFSYNRVPWKLKVFVEHEWRKPMFNSHLLVFQIRKEVFSPSEQLTNPTTIHLVFCQAIKTIKFFYQSIPHIEEKRSKRWTVKETRHTFDPFTRHQINLSFTDVQYRSSLTPSAPSASV